MIQSALLDGQRANTWALGTTGEVQAGRRANPLEHMFTGAAFGEGRVTLSKNKRTLQPNGGNATCCADTLAQAQRNEEEVDFSDANSENGNGPHCSQEGLG